MSLMLRGFAQMKYLIPIPRTDPCGRIGGTIHHPAVAILLSAPFLLFLTYNPFSAPPLLPPPHPSAIYCSIIYFIYTFNKRAYVPRHPGNLWRWGLRLGPSGGHTAPTRSRACLCAHYLITNSSQWQGEQACLKVVMKKLHTTKCF